MKLVRTLGLLAVLVALSAYVYFYEIKGGEEREKQQELEEKIFHFETDSVELVEIRSIFNQFRFERDGEQWTITSPIETDGDNSAINSMLNTMRDVKMTREFTIRDGEQKDYGLVARSVLVIVQFKNGERDSLRLGDATPVGGSNYAGRGDTLMYIVSSSAKSAVEKQLFDWRDKSISKIEQNDVQALGLKNAHGTFYFEKEGLDWHITKPREVMAENATINTILRKIQNDKVKSVVAEELTDPAKYDLDKPRYVVDLYLGEGKAHKQVMFSRLKNNVSYGKDGSRPHTFTIDSTFIKDLDKTFFELRDKRVVTSVERGAIDSIVVEQGDSLVAFVKDTSNTWGLVADTSKVKNWKVNSLLGNIVNLKAEMFLLEDVSTTRKYSLSQPERIVRVFSNGKQQAELLLAAPKADQHVAFCPDSKIVAEITETSYSNFEVKKPDYIE